MKMLRAAFVALLMIAAAMPAHAGKMAKSKEPLVVEPGKAMIVFMRPGKFVGAAVSLPVYDATVAPPEFIGLVDAGSKLAYSVEPGEHVLMTTVFGGAAGVRLYKAQVEAGKTYYFRAHIIDGIWGLEPVRGADLAGEDFADWDKATKLTVNTPKTLAWGEANKAKAAERLSVLDQTQIPEQNTLHAEDGR